jgi:hypothetical protein
MVKSTSTESAPRESEAEIHPRKIKKNGKQGPLAEQDQSTIYMEF